MTNSGVWYHCLYLAATWHKMFHTVSHKCYELAHAAHCHYLLHSLSRCVTSRILEKMSLVGSSLLSIISVKAQHCSWSIIINIQYHGSGLYSTNVLADIIRYWVLDLKLSGSTSDHGACAIFKNYLHMYRGGCSLYWCLEVSRLLKSTRDSASTTVLGSLFQSSTVLGRKENLKLSIPVWYVTYCLL